MSAFQVERGGIRLFGEAEGDGPAVVLVHGLTATRRYVVHGARVLPRSGFRQIAYDARGHGESDPAPPGAGYDYGALAGDLAAVVDHEAGEGPVVLAGHSMGAHTVVAEALARPERLAAIVVMGPVFLDAYDEEVLARWDRLADGLEHGGIDGFLEVVGEGLEPAWRQTVLRFTRQRMLEHRDLDAILRALREVPRSQPLDSLDELSALDMPALVVASRDEADPNHPHAVAETYADHLPDARLIREEEGEAPLVWRGGSLAREIVAFCAEPAVAERLAT